MTKWHSIVNLTPHTVMVGHGPGAGTWPSFGVARVDPLPLGPVVGLPAPKRGTIYIVSVIVAERLPMRRDLRVPGDQIRDADGRVIGAGKLARPRDVSPALAILLALADADQLPTVGAEGA